MEISQEMDLFQVYKPTEMYCKCTQFWVTAKDINLFMELQNTLIPKDNMLKWEVLFPT